MLRPIALLLVLALLMGGCDSGSTDGTTAAEGAGGEATSAPSATDASPTEPDVDGGPLEVAADAFGDGEAIPVRLTCDGEDLSPRLFWTSVPEDTQEYALIMDDPDAGGFVHWVVYGIPATGRELSEGGSTSEFVQGVNDFGRTGYGGPCPPPGGPHRYTLAFHALSAPIDLEPGASADDVRAAIAGSLIETDVLTGVYTRQ